MMFSKPVHQVLSHTCSASKQEKSLNQDEIMTMETSNSIAEGEVSGTPLTQPMIFELQSDWQFFNNFIVHFSYIKNRTEQHSQCFTAVLKIQLRILQN